MTRTVLAIATALLAATTFFAPAAEACISCAYTPEVVSSGSKSHAAKSYESKSALIASKALAARLAKERAAKAQMIAKKMEATKTAKAEVDKDRGSRSEACRREQAHRGCVAGCCRGCTGRGHDQGRSGRRLQEVRLGDRHHRHGALRISRGPASSAR